MKIDELLSDLPIISTMVNEDHIRIILNELQSVDNIMGDVVEFGCNVGTTSVFIQSYLNGSKQFRVYDSFEGFPEKDIRDEGEEYHFKFEKGGCKTDIQTFTETFENLSIPLPFMIHKGWFKDIPDFNLPEKISFAFFDSDFYSSIMDSWEKVYPRLSPGAVVCVHDYAWEVLPGVKLACDDFLKDKPETMIFNNFIGILKKMRL